jgi:hypothetical protein
MVTIQNSSVDPVCCDALQLRCPTVTLFNWGDVLLRRSSIEAMSYCDALQLRCCPTVTLFNWGDVLLRRSSIEAMSYCDALQLRWYPTVTLFNWGYVLLWRSSVEVMSYCDALQLRRCPTVTLFNWGDVLLRRFCHSRTVSRTVCTVFWKETEINMADWCYDVISYEAMYCPQT